MVNGVTGQYGLPVQQHAEVFNIDLGIAQIHFLVMAGNIVKMYHLTIVSVTMIVVPVSFASIRALFILDILASYF